MVTSRTQKRIASLVTSIDEKGIALNVGAGATRISTNIINVDIYDSGETDVLASALALPFADNFVDLVILQGVLEHVEDAQQTITECYRVLKPGGLFYTEMPFLQPYHECPIDMMRRTRPGLAHLCLPLKEVETGIHIGPASTITWILRETLAGAISRGKYNVHRYASTLIGWCVFPIKYADYFLEKIPSLHTVASSCYYLGRKG
ncbi:MAG: class I SAM-dependent methyltransferase [Acidobacteriota bacterium]